MQQSINIQMSPDEFKDSIRDVMRLELKVVKDVLGSIMISASEARKHLGIKSHTTLMNLVKEGRLLNHSKPGEHPKFSLSEIIELKSNNHERSFHV